MLTFLSDINIFLLSEFYIIELIWNLLFIISKNEYTW